MVEITDMELNIGGGAVLSSPFHSVDILQHIISFVGVNQYRFVAPISHGFQLVYLKLYPGNKQTYFNASSLEHAEISLEGQDNRHSKALCTSAARHGSLSTLLYLRSMDFPWNKGTFCMAAKFGHVHIIEFLYAKHCPFASNTCSYAALNGHVSVLKWAKTNDFPWHDGTCSSAAHNNHLAVLQWARENGCPWNKLTCQYAAKNGHLKLLQ
jgi:hypothetical protein